MWREAYLENRVMSADPVELVHMLYERAIGLVGGARKSLAKGDIAERSKSIQKVLEIIMELEMSLNHEQGGQIAWNLARLYRHMRNRLLEANLKQQDQPLAEVEALLQTLDEGWKGILPHSAATGEMRVADAPETSNRWAGSESEESKVCLAGHSWKA